MTVVQLLNTIVIQHRINGMLLFNGMLHAEFLSV